MNSVIEIINQIAATSSTNDKLNILKQNKGDKLLQKVLKYTYDDSLKFGITEDAIRPYIVDTGYCDYPFDILDTLVSSNINDGLRKEVGMMLGSLTDEYRDLFIKILTKDLRCGISTKTIQKVWKDLIPKWEVQQAYPLHKVKLKNNEWIAISEKLNGSRGSFFSGEIKSRQNKVFQGLDHVIADINYLGLQDWFIDGELIRDNVDSIPDNENFRKSLSILSSDDIDKSEIIFKIYDVVPKEEFLNGESKLKYPDRIKQLQNISDTINEICIEENRNMNIKVLPILYQGNDHSQIDKWLDYADNNNWEGCMLYRDSTYKCKRHNGILKVKSFLHCDVLCTGVYEGTGKYKGMLGGITVDYKGFECGCGSGFDDGDRGLLWKNKDNIVGKIVQIKYKEESKNKDGGVSMQFPIYECIRPELTEPSYN